MPAPAPVTHQNEVPGPQLVPSQDLVASLPAPVLRLLVLFAWQISFLRTALEVLCWKSGKRVESWMVIGAWWGLCLGSKHAFRYLLPPLLFLPLLNLGKLNLGPEKTPSTQSSAAQPSTLETLLVTLSDLHSIQALLPPSPIPTASSIYSRFQQLGPFRLVRGLLVIWASWIILGRIIGFHSLLAIAGTIFLLLPSPPLAHLINLLNKSLAVRRAVALAFLFTFGSPPDHTHPISLHFSALGWAKSKWTASRRPSVAFSFRPRGNQEALHGSAIEAEEAEEKAGNPIYFHFEVHENQRWWMGLDWTSALLPQERPSWCDSHLLPVSPPPSFTLPAAASIILPAPTKQDPHARVKRTATWRWLDDDWSVVRAGSSAPALSVAATSPEPENEGFSLGHQSNRSLSIATGLGGSPPKPSQSVFDDTISPTVRAQSIAEHAFSKGLERLKGRTTSPVVTQAKTVTASPARTSGEFKRGRAGSQASEDLRAFEVAAVVASVETSVEKDDVTDADGWVYGDNKWESMGARGGLGKFTRRRRWQRRAVCTETVQRIPSESKDAPPSPNALKAPPTVATVSEVKVEPIIEEKNGAREPEGMIIPPGSPVTRDDQLRLRLKKTMGSVGG